MITEEQAQRYAESYVELLELRVLNRQTEDPTQKLTYELRLRELVTEVGVLFREMGKAKGVSRLDKVGLDIDTHIKEVIINN